MRSIKNRSFVALFLICMMILGIARSGYYAADIAHRGIETVYNDRILPLRDLKVVSDLYAVNIVDTAHKVRNGNIDWKSGTKSVSEAITELKRRWKSYVAASAMTPREKALAGEVEQRMQAGDLGTP
jgi:methyl-accepting chemotaxis protein